MKAITLPSFGGVEALTVSEIPAPRLGAGEVLIDVAAAGVNRADVMQRMGLYPPPKGESELPGLEVSGTIRDLGSGVSGWQIGDEVCALLAGGGYAQQVVVPAGQLLPVPRGISLIEAAALPEVTATVWSNLFMTAHLMQGETVLIHGGSSGIGTMAIQLAKARGAKVAVTAGTDDKLDVCRSLGADILINYKEQDFVQEVTADVILDVMGAKYLDRNIDALAADGRLVIIGLQGGVSAELSIGKLLGKRGSVMATSLRSRPKPEKAAIVRKVREQVWPLIEAGQVRPIIDRTFALDDVAQAHELMESSTHIGKILLHV